MNQLIAVRERLTRFAGLVQAELMLPEELRMAAESQFALQVERGLVLPIAVIGSGISEEPYVQRLIELANLPHLGEMLVVDASGQQRKVYRPLLIYAWLTAFQLRYESLPREQFGRWEEGLRAWCDLLEGELGRIAPPGQTIPAARGGDIAEGLWMALALHVAGKVFIRDAWTDLAADWMGRCARAQNADGSFLIGGASDSPEMRWYHELVILHAAATYAVRAEDRTVSAAVQRAGEFHLSQTQPDHATTQPWGLFAFIWNEPTQPLAEQTLHAISLRRAEGLDGVSLILLADVLYCLRLFL
jgi:hypothetical protein